ncbi:hypothetical protein BO71DRAFT_381483 [Aspergillus ellipticus CBS 707.79]|uniref:Uncharacterized protein n=1 Tax=Aspergillus ellipticus CBS 707.79 TaxID=1448320 RepID=A0A319D8M8_9EURO|nr:hypothetical protein BO71DRAFT_381483 [Aspergillus ellipticus CBS 707.79]
MFAFNPKRPRDQEHDDFDGNAVREKKKHRSLPLRTPPAIFQSPSFAQNNRLVASRLGLSTLTPVESSDDDREDNGFSKHARNGLTDTWNGPPQQGPQYAVPMLSSDMDIDDSKDTVGGDTHGRNPADAGSNYSLRPSPIPPSLVSQSLTISERTTVQTPCGFVSPAMNTMDRMGSKHSASSPHPSAPRDPYSAQDRVWWCGQRLPSPVSDSGDAMASNGKDSASDVDMTYNISQPASPPDLHQEDLIQEYSPASTSKKKAAFSMGYRADCDKCRRRVPGHYSHIIRC